MIEGRTPPFVSAAEITRNFGKWQDRASHGPLVVTHHGRPRVIMTAIEDYEALIAPPAEPDAREQSDSAALTVLLDQIGAGFVMLDEQLHILRLNDEAIAHFALPRERTIGRTLVQLFPSLEPGLVIAQIRHAVRERARNWFEAPSELRPGRMLHFQCFPLPGGTGLMFRNGSEEWAQWRAIGEASALSAARAAHGRVAVARLSLRATFDHVEPGFAALSGFVAERLAGVRLTDLLALSRRAAAAAEIETVLGERTACAFDSVLLVNGGGELAVRIGMAPIADGFVIRGAMVTLTGEGDA